MKTRCATTCTCPYCAEKFKKDQLYTKDQLEHAENQATELAKEYMYGEIDKMFGNFASRNRGGLIKFTHTPIRYKAKPVVARYREREVDSELTCPECGVIFQVFGIFGFCPGCRSENQAIYDANLAIVRQEIANAPDRDRALRHAYSDLVSAFESFCIRRAPAECRGTNFQDLSRPDALSSRAETWICSRTSHKTNCWCCDGPSRNDMLTFTTAELLASGTSRKCPRMLASWVSALSCRSRNSKRRRSRSDWLLIV